MTNLTQKSSQQFLGAAMRVVTLALFLAVFGASAALAQTRGYVTNSDDDTVSVIDTANNNTVVATVSVGDGPAGVAVTPNGAFVYVTNNSSNTVSVISAATNTVVDTVTVGNGPTGIAITPDGASAYVVNSADGTVSVIDTVTNDVTHTIATGTFVVDIAITPNGAFAYVTGLDVGLFQGVVTVIDTANNSVADTVSVGSLLAGIAVSCSLRRQRAGSDRRRAGAVHCHRHGSDHGRDKAAWWDHPGELRHFGLGDASGEFHRTVDAPSG